MSRSLLLTFLILGLTMAVLADRPSLKEAAARGRVLFQASGEYGGSGYVDDDGGIIDDIGDLFGSPSPASTGVGQEDNNDGGVSFWYVVGILAVSVVALVIVVAIIGGVIVAGVAIYKKKQQKKSSSDNFDYIQMGPDIPTEIN